MHSSTKQKKIQLKALRSSERSLQASTMSTSQVVEEESHNFRLNESNRNKDRKSAILTVFHVKESLIDVEKRITSSRVPFLYSCLNLLAPSNMYKRVIPIPLRPAWNNRMSREDVQANETERFEKYLSILYQAFPPHRLNHFEHNLDVWRQLWRVCELSDVLVLTVDSRHPLFHFPPSLYDYIVVKLKKPMVIVFNKIDLVPSKVLLDWQKYFEKKYPGVLVLLVSSHPSETVTCENNNAFELRSAAAGLNGQHMNKKKKPVGIKQLLYTWRMLAQDAHTRKQQGLELNEESLLELTRKIKQDILQYNNTEENITKLVHDLANLNLEEKTKLQEKLTKKHAEMKLAEEAEEDEDEDADEDTEQDEDAKEDKTTTTTTTTTTAIDNTPLKHKFTVGLVGHPNAGKSSLINSIIGKTVVSVSNTPGHTKHLQTVLSIPDAEYLQLLDCPGLVFPAADVPKPLQLLMGIFPLTSLREPYTSVQYLCERIPVVELYGLQPYMAPEGDAAIYGANCPGGVNPLKDAQASTASADTRQSGNTTKTPSHLTPILTHPMDPYQKGKYSTVSSDTEHSHYMNGIVSSEISQDLMKAGQKKGGKKKGKNKRDEFYMDSTDDYFKTANMRENLIEQMDYMLSQSMGQNTNTDSSIASIKPRYVWSAWRVCEALAVKKGWRGEGNTPDTYRAGMSILKDVLEGKILLFFQPPATME